MIEVSFRANDRVDDPSTGVQTAKHPTRTGAVGVLNTHSIIAPTRGTSDSTMWLHIRLLLTRTDADRADSDTLVTRLGHHRAVLTVPPAAELAC